MTTPKLWTVWITTGKFLKRLEYQRNWYFLPALPALPASWEICMQVKKRQLESDMEQWTGSKLGKEYIKAVYCHPAYLTYSRVHHVKCQAGWSTATVPRGHKRVGNDWSDWACTILIKLFFHTVFHLPYWMGHFLDFTSILWVLWIFFLILLLT